jgi:hypothetical protein
VATSPTLAAPIDRRRPRPTPDHDLQLPCQISGKEQAVLEAARLAQVKAPAEWQDKVRALEAQVAQIQAELDLIRPQKP